MLPNDLIENDYRRCRMISSQYTIDNNQTLTTVHICQRLRRVSQPSAGPLHSRRD